MTGERRLERVKGIERRHKLEKSLQWYLKKTSRSQTRDSPALLQRIKCRQLRACCAVSRLASHFDGASDTACLMGRGTRPVRFPVSFDQLLKIHYIWFSSWLLL